MASRAKETAALATLFNPLVKNEQDLLTFSTTFCSHNAGDLALVQRRNPSKGGEIRFPENVHHQPGLIKTPSSIVALQLNDTINVYGVSAGNPPLLKRLSPTVEPMAIDIRIDKPVSLAGLTSPYDPENSDQPSGWLYFLSANNKISEYKIGSEHQPTEGKRARPDSHIAAVFHDQKRWVFFQGEDESVIKVAQIDSRKDEDIDDSDKAKEGTPLVACTAKNAADEDLVYVYYVNKSNELYRASGRDMASLKSVPLMNGKNYVKVFSWLAVSPGAKHNFVSYITENHGKQYLAIYADDRK